MQNFFWAPLTKKTFQLRNKQDSSAFKFRLYGLQDEWYWMRFSTLGTHSSNLFFNWTTNSTSILAFLPREWGRYSFGTPGSTGIVWIYLDTALIWFRGPLTFRWQLYNLNYVVSSLIVKTALVVSRYYLIFSSLRWMPRSSINFLFIADVWVNELQVFILVFDNKAQNNNNKQWRRYGHSMLQKQYFWLMFIS